VQRAGCDAANAVSRPPEALSMTEQSAGRNGSDRSSRLRGVLARNVSLTRHSTAVRSVIQADAAVAEVPIASGGRGGQLFFSHLLRISYNLIVLIIALNSYYMSFLIRLKQIHRLDRHYLRFYF